MNLAEFGSGLVRRFLNEQRVEGLRQAYFKGRGKLAPVIELKSSGGRVVEIAAGCGPHVPVRGTHLYDVAFQPGLRLLSKCISES